MASSAEVGGDVKAALTLAAVLVVLATLVGETSVGIAVTIIVFLLIVYSMTRVPVRLSMMALMFFAFALPNVAEGQPTPWAPPFATVGAILLDHLNTIDRSIGAFSALSFSGMDLLFGVLFLIILQRKSSGSKLDSAGRVPTPRPLIQLAQLSLAGTAFAWLSGMVRGGNFGYSLWGINAVIYLPIVFLLFSYALRGPKDHWNLARVLVAAASYKCLLGLYVVSTITVPMDPETGSTRPAYATAHSDSMLFAAAFVAILAPLVERVGGRARRYAILVLPILAAGTWANNRRLAWVQVALVFVTVFLVSRESPVKRKIRRTLLFMSFPAVLYCIAGWNSAYGALFKPVRMVRSVVDAQTDASSLWRELENMNIVATFKLHPLLGTGWGHPYEEVAALPAVDYSLELYMPHNSLLGLWGYTGYVGFATLSLLWVAGVYFAMRAYYGAKEPQMRAAALVSFGAVLAYLMQSWGDLGLGQWTGIFLMGAGLSVAGKLAVSSGQWTTTAKGRQPPRAT
ncbi:MAG: O-antigen ligase family protein [Myxococcales bacterium]